MANQIKMAVRDSILTLYEKRYSQRRIAKILQIDRETVARHLRESASSISNPAIVLAGTGAESEAKPAIVPTGKPGRRSECEPFRAPIESGLDKGLSAQRIFQDLRTEHAFCGGYDSVKRFIRKLTAAHPKRVHRMECAAGEEAQVDFGLGAVIVENGHKRRSWVFRIILSYSRKSYSEAVTRQTTECFIRCLENAFRYLGGVPRILIIDNLRAAVKQADWYEPELTPKVAEFCRYYGTAIVPTRPYSPEHKGKVENSVRYVKNNALKGREFSSLSEENRYLLWWESTVADQRIHGTTRQHVGRCFEEREKPALNPLPAMIFPCFEEGRRRVHRDAFVEVHKAYYEVPEEYIARDVWVRYDTNLVRIFTLNFELILTHARVAPGSFQRRPGGINYSVEHSLIHYQKKVLRLGAKAGEWADRMLSQRGPMGIKVLHGVLGLTRQYTPRQINEACAQALSLERFRLRELRALLEQPEAQEEFSFLSQHPLIRDMADYGAILEALYPENNTTEGVQR